MSLYYEGLTPRSSVVVAPDALVISVADAAVQHLRTVNGSAEDDYIERLIRAATGMAERRSQRAIPPQTRTLVLERFLCSATIPLPFPPLIDVERITYVDPDGETQEIDPADYRVTKPEGPTAGPGAVTIASGAWPSTRCQPDAVTIRYRAGYSDGASPEGADAPLDLVQGILLLVGELYKQRSESVSGLSVSAAAMIRANDIFDGYRVY